MSWTFKVLLAAAVVISAGLAFILFLAEPMIGIGTGDFTGDNMTPAIIKEVRDRYKLPPEAHIMHVLHRENINSGFITLQCEIPVAQWNSFLAHSRFKNAALRSDKDAPGQIHPVVLPDTQAKEIRHRGKFMIGTTSKGKRDFILLVDQSRDDIYGVYIQETVHGFRND